jgi:hypothetical protein
MTTKLRLKKTASVTREMLSMTIGEDYYLEFQTRPYLAKEQRTRALKEGEKVKAPPMLADVLAFSEDDSGVLTKEYTIICNAVLVSILEDNFPGDAVIGERLIVTKLDKISGRDYNLFNVSTFDLDDGTDPEVVEAPQPNKSRRK